MGENRLGREQSPYLLQHKDNPIWWYPWGEEAFNAAQSEGKPIFLSIGYSTCYWCHVMAHESFEDPEVGNFLNEHFISIKLDREERPDLDMVYMDAVIAISGRGGWPLTLVLTPDGKPFFGGTYFRKDQLLGILSRIRQGWSAELGDIVASADKVMQYLVGQVQPHAPTKITEPLAKAAWDNVVSGFDPVWGGFGSAPKFPPSSVLRFIMRRDHVAAEGMVNATLAGMARGGIFDHIEGGFSRYSVDEKWRVPHFEKMLYDNASLASIYLEAATAYDAPFYREVASLTLSYLENNLSDQNGGFYAAEDAGEPGKEGEFYVWTKDELAQGLSQEHREALNKVYLLDGPPTFEGKAYVLAMREDAIWVDRNSPEVRDALQALYKIRATRKRPFRDEKIITAWNGLAIAAFARGGRVLGDPRLVKRAERAAVFIRDNLWDGVELSRRAIGDSVGMPACLDDYAFLVDGLIELYQANGDERIIRWATTLMAAQEKQFRDPKGTGYVYSASPDVIVPKHDELDHALPSSSAISAWNLVRLSGLNQDPSLLDRAKAVIAAVSPVIERVPLIGATTILAHSWVLRGPEIGVVVGSNGPDEELREYLDKSYAPYLTIAPAGPGAVGPLCIEGKQALDGKATLYLCVGATCKPGVQSVEEARAMLEKS